MMGLRKLMMTTNPEMLCACKDRPAKDCPGEWEPNCDLGNNPAFVRQYTPTMTEKHLVPNWRQVLARSYTTWLSVAAAVSGAIELVNQIAPTIMPFLPPHVAGYVSVGLAVAVPVGRVLKQNFSRE